MRTDQLQTPLVVQYESVDTMLEDAWMHSECVKKNEETKKLMPSLQILK